MNERPPVSAGTFYENSPDACRKHAMELIESVNPPDDLPKRIFGGLVPHAGWVFSGALAAMTFKALLRRTGTETPKRRQGPVNIQPEGTGPSHGITKTQDT